MNYLLFKRWNDFSGWLVFLIAAFVYGMTIEPTASFWDCPEFISCAEKLQVGHPPGAPFYMLVGNLFTQFASDPSQVSRTVNFLNALLSAGCILFLFWSITRLVRSLLKEEKENLSVTDVIIILGSGLVGALAYTFSDTFWFSAVEGEVYAFSSFLTALVFWMILRWQDESDTVYGDRWIILIAYIIGLSIGVHLLNLLCIPAIVLVFYYQKYRTISLKGAIAAIALSGLLIVLILFVYIPGMADIGGWFELLFVNALGFPFQTGLIGFLAITFFLLIAGIYRFKKRLINTALWCILMLTVGYTTYAVILIRANANTPLNENAPDNIFALKSYLNREQYESAPLLYGKTYASEPEYVPEGDYYKVKMKTGGAVYRPNREEGKYKVIRNKEEVCYTQNMLFSRMWNDRMASSYKSWSEGTDGAPTQKENLTYFFAYQLNYMYWRYFLWNFVGRQNDIQGHGEPEHGNWITGIPLLDNLRLGDQELLPESLRQNKGHNVFYALPLLLGLIGIYWQWMRGKKGMQQFSVVFFLFFMTGLAIVLYLNQTPGQPRERDYAYAGSFYAFAIWIGMGAAGLCDALRKKKSSVLQVGLLMFLCLLIPVQMASQTWDDHDRSNRFTCRDFGANYLMTLPDKGNPIIFSNGDNDTFPLWYNQDTEGVRRDARICNLSYAQTRRGFHVLGRVRHGDAEPRPAEHGNVVFPVADGDGLLARYAEDRRHARETRGLVDARRHDLQRFRAGRKAVHRLRRRAVQLFRRAPYRQRQTEQQDLVYPLVCDLLGGGKRQRRARGALRVHLRSGVHAVGINAAAAVNDGGARPPAAPAEHRERGRFVHQGLGKRFARRAALHQSAVSENERHIAGEELTRDLGAAAEPSGGERYELSRSIYGADRLARVRRNLPVGAGEREIIIGGHQSVCHNIDFLSRESITDGAPECQERGDLRTAKHVV